MITFWTRALQLLFGGGDARCNNGCWDCFCFCFCCCCCCGASSHHIESLLSSQDAMDAGLVARFCVGIICHLHCLLLATWLRCCGYCSPPAGKHTHTCSVHRCYGHSKYLQRLSNSARKINDAIIGLVLLCCWSSLSFTVIIFTLDINNPEGLKKLRHATLLLLLLLLLFCRRRRRCYTWHQVHLAIYSFIIV